MLLGLLISDDNTLCLHIALQFIFTLSFDQNNRVCMVWWRGLFSPWRCGQKAQRLNHLPNVSPVLKPEPRPDLGSRTPFSSTHRVLPIINAVAD